MINTSISIDPRQSSSPFSNATVGLIQPQTIEKQQTQQHEEVNTILQQTNRSSYVTNMLVKKLNESTLEPYKKKRYLVKRSPVMMKTIQNLAPDLEQLKKLTGDNETISVSINKLIPMVNLGPHQQFLGCNLSKGKVQNSVSDKLESHLVTHYFYQDYIKEKNKLEKLAILDQLDKLNKMSTLDTLTHLNSADRSVFKEFFERMTDLGMLRKDLDTEEKMDILDNLDKLDIKDIQQKLDHFSKQCKIPKSNKTEKILFWYALGRACSYLFMPGDGWTLKPITSAEDKRITGIHVEKDDCLSVIDMFNDLPQLSDEATKGINALLTKCIDRNTINQEEAKRVIGSLEPVSKHFDEGLMVADVVILPKMVVQQIDGKDKHVIDEQRKNYVYVECTPIDKNYLQPRQVFMAEDIVLDGKNNIRLSDQLREDIQAYFKSKGWDNCLGKTLRLNPEDSALNTSNLSDVTVNATVNHAIKSEGSIDWENLEPLKKAFLSFSSNRAIRNDPKESRKNAERAKRKMEVIKDGIYLWAKDNVTGIVPKDFQRLMGYLSKKVSIVTYSECLSQVLRAIEYSLEKQPGSVQDFKNFKELLKACRENLEFGIKLMKFNTAEDTVAYLLLSELNTTITALDEKIAAHDGMNVHQSAHMYQHAHLEEEEKSAS